VTLELRSLAAQATAIAALITLAACGGGGGSPTSPSGPATGSPGPSGATVTIGSNGAVSPSQVTVSAGQSVTFVNNDSRVHDIESDPHPSHTDCPQINAAGLITPGQTKVTNAFTNVRTCGFHDHSNPDVAALTGRIIIQ
jgi:plastocyanin